MYYMLSFCICILVTGHYNKDIVMLCYVYDDDSFINILSINVYIYDNPALWRKARRETVCAIV